MRELFEYNWQVRDEWFEWCSQLTSKELLEERIGGVGSILHTLFHITEVEYSWVTAIQGNDDIVYEFSDYNSLEKVKRLSNDLRIEIRSFLKSGADEKGKDLVTAPWDAGTYKAEEILRHIIVHEIHHIGQLSVWSREIKLDPVQANFIGRKFD
ncbi:DinB family protein [Bacillus sp. FJAT-27251]|uniref:DinB family protein n=1 Tax=Bacillus sp. FJAT-27251 TaxID=1684142 RepID=UPI0006A7BB36|nr:DinB family protein [Bacillus sp. FJAT-27251]